MDGRISEILTYKRIVDCAKKDVMNCRCGKQAYIGQKWCFEHLMNPPPRGTYNDNLSTHYIYGLYDSSGEVHYVGVARDIRGRRLSHIKSFPELHMRILEYIGVWNNNRLDREKWWMKEMIRRGAILRNIVIPK